MSSETGISAKSGAGMLREEASFQASAAWFTAALPLSLPLEPVFAAAASAAVSGVGSPAGVVFSGVSEC